MTDLIKLPGRVYLAKFPPVRVRCAYLRGSAYPRVRHFYGQSHDTYKLIWLRHRSEIRANELQYETGCYPPPWLMSTTRWRATRDAPDPASPDRF